MQLSKVLLIVVAFLSVLAVTAVPEKQRRLRALGKSKKRALGKGSKSKQTASKASGGSGGQNSAGEGCNGEEGCTGGTNFADVAARSAQCNGNITSTFLIDKIDEFFDEAEEDREAFLCTKDEECSTCCCYLHWAFLTFLPNGQPARYCASAEGLSDAAFGGCVSKELEIPQGNNTGQVP